MSRIILINILFRDLLFRYEFTCKLVFFENICHIVNPFDELMVRFERFQKVSKFLRETLQAMVAVSCLRDNAGVHFKFCSQTKIGVLACDAKSLY